MSNLASFFYINSIDETNYFLDFDEGAGEISAQVESGDYTFTQLALAIQDALNQYGTFNYTVSFLRDERRFQILSSSPVILLLSTGTHVATTAFTLIGFTGADTSNIVLHTANLQAGTEYITQFPLQSFIDQEDFQKAISASVNKSASGVVEVIKFGTEKFYELEIMFITNIDQGTSGPIRTNLTGVQDARLLMRFLVSKRNLEMMLDSDDKDTFVTVLCEKTESDSNGTGYKLEELYGKGLPGYFQSGKITLRLVE